MSTPYHTGHRLPFPALTVGLHGEAERLSSVIALLDTGADVTLVPIALLEQVGASEGGLVAIRTHFGEVHHAQHYLVSIEASGILLPGVYVVGDDHGEDVILGRDVLNKLPLFLDGPEQQAEILDDATASRLRVRR